MISVIVPVYNVAGYLDRCIKSILNQTYSDLEVILVNDGSTDGSDEICLRYKNEDPRITVISQSNQGVSVARNAALEVAHGEWISFVDSDDYLDSDFYECLIDASKKSNSDVICCGVRPVNESGQEVPHLLAKNIPQKSLKMDMEKVYKHFFVLPERFIYWSPFDKLFRASIAKEFRFEPGKKRAEDFYYCFSCFRKSNSLYYIPEKKYNYLQRMSSVTHSKLFDESNFDPLYFVKKSVDCLKKESASEKVIEYAESLYVMMLAKLIKSFYSKKSASKEKFASRVFLCRSEIKTYKKLYDNFSLRFRMLCVIARYVPFIFKLRIS